MTTTPTRPPMLDICEQGTEPFLVFETAAIDRHDGRIEGIPDSLWGDYRDTTPEEFNLADRINLFRSHFAMLGTWLDSIAELSRDLELLGPNGSLTVAAGRYLEYEYTAWKDARANLISGVVDYFLGRDEFGHPFAAHPDWRVPTV